MPRSLFVLGFLLAAAPAGEAQCRLFEIVGATDQIKYQMGYSVSGAGDVDGDGIDEFMWGNPSEGAGGMVHVVTLADPTTDLLTIVGPAGSKFGHAVSGAGDVNNDGFADLVVGAPQGASTNGIARVISGIDGSTLHSVTGLASGDLLGFAVSDAGDVNGDGYDDVVVGTGTGLSGYARVMSGKDGSTLFHLTSGTGEDAAFGAAVAGAGDVNGDGVPDVLISAAIQDSPLYMHAGVAWVFSGADGAILHKYYGRGTHFHFGASLDGIGDVDADGFDDFAVGEPDNNLVGNSGTVTVFTGKTGGTLYNLIGPGPLTDGGRFGYSLAGAGDVNGDQVPDVAIGEPFHKVYWEGRVLVVSGNNGQTLFERNGWGPGDHFGWSVSGAGDQNGNGTNEVVVGAPWLASSGDFGHVDVYSAACGESVVYGSGCPGGNGLTPQMSVFGDATPAGEVTLAVSKGPANAAAFLAFGQQTASIPIAGMCTLNVTPLSPILLGPLPLGATGSIALDVVIPLGTPLGTLTTQTFTVDAGVPHGYANSNGVRLTIE